MRDTTLVFNGVQGATGEYALQGETLEGILQAFDRQAARRRGSDRGVAFGVEPGRLASAGWGVVFPRDGDPAVRDALEPLIDHRRKQVSDESRFRVLDGEDGLLPGESKGDYLARQGVAPGPVRPEIMPYYLLLVGSPREIPFEVQYQLDAQHAVGRLSFDTPWEYSQYAESVVAAEAGRCRRPRRTVLLAPRNPDDAATGLSSRYLVKPLFEGLSAVEDWRVDSLVGEGAAKAAFTSHLGGEETPALLFAACHGLCFDAGDPLQRSFQGSLLCQDWPGPKAWHRAIPREHIFAGSDVASGADVAGLVAFLFACYGAGTPRLDDFDRTVRGRTSVIAPEAVVSRLAQRLLGHPKGGALAVVGHVERAWSYSFLWRSTAHVAVFESALRGLLEGWTVGMSMEFFAFRLAELGSELIHALDARGAGREASEALRLWAAHHDARNYVVLGDPAVRLAVEEALDDG